MSTMHDERVSFIDEERIFSLLEAAKSADKSRAMEVIAKGRECKGLDLGELAVLLQTQDQEVIQAIYDAAFYVKNHIYGRRLVFFAPLYASNVCANNCLYCAFRRDNKDLHRITLTMDQVKREVEILLSEGHKRILILAGEHPKLSGIDYLEQVIAAAYECRVGNATMRRINVNCAPLSIEDFKRLKACSIGTFQCFQETYHRETYKIMHPSGPKADMLWRLHAPSRSIEAGIDDVGIGPLLGLTDFKFEIMATLMHAQFLDKTYGVGPHTISVPRIEPALNAPAANPAPFPITEDNMRRIVSTLRLAVPYTGIILSTRERAEFRNELIGLGISQLSAGSRVNPGGYYESKAHIPEADQFAIGDDRSLAQMITQLSKGDYIPSFCTGCYRKGRTGETFMGLAKEGEIHTMCAPNAILSFKEYLIDYADPETRAEGERIIAKELEELEPKMRKKTVEFLSKIEQGDRDVYV